MASAVDAAVRPDDPPWLKAAFSRLGLKEVPGTRDNPIIVDMFARIGRADIRDDETSWCAAFVGWCLLDAGGPASALPPKAERLLARSYLAYGHRITAPVRGSIIVFRRGSSSWQGHVAFFLRFVTIDGARYAEVIGGNQSNAVTIARYRADAVLGYRWPADHLLPGAAVLEPASSEPKAATAAAKVAPGAAVAISTGSIAAAAFGVPWWAIVTGAVLGLAGAAALIFLLIKRG